MIKPILFLFAILISSTSIAQFEEQKSETNLQNKYFVGGTLRFVVDDNNNGVRFLVGVHNNDFDYKSIAFRPVFGITLSNNIVLGVNSILTRSESTSMGIDQRSESNSSSIGVGLFARFMVKPTSKIVFYLSPYTGFYKSISEFENSGFFTDKSKTTQKYTNIGLGLGLQYTIIPNLRATASLGGISYANGISTQEGDMVAQEKDFSSFQIELDLGSTFFGLEYLF